MAQTIRGRMAAQVQIIRTIFGKDPVFMPLPGKFGVDLGDLTEPIEETYDLGDIEDLREEIK